MCDADRDRDLAGGVDGPCLQPLHQAACETERVSRVAGGKDDGELLAADAADDVARAHERRRHLAERDEDLVPDAVAADVVDALELVDVEHEQGDGVACTARACQLCAEPLVEVAVVEEAGQRVRLRLVLEARTHLRVVEGERCSVAEPLRELELVLRKGRAGADAVDVEGSLERAARDQRDRDQRLRLGAACRE